MIIGYGITTALSVLFFVLYRILIKKGSVTTNG